MTPILAVTRVFVLCVGSTMGMMACSPNHSYHIRFKLPDQQASQSVTDIVLFILAAESATCEDLLQTPTQASQDWVVLAKTIIPYPPNGPTLLRTDANGQVVFFAQGRTRQQTTILHGCAQGMLTTDQGLRLQLTLEWTCQSNPQGEIPNNLIDDDCNGQVDECKTDLDCDDEQGCTSDFCSLGECHHSHFPDGLPCDDANRCTSTDSCQQGVCVGHETTCTHFDAECTKGDCNPQTGLCEESLMDNGTACDDGLLCTLLDHCQDEICIGTPFDCEEVPTSCDGECSASCPCGVGEGDCDRDSDCQSGLRCPPDTDGNEYCEKVPNSELLAFPTAEGYGRLAQGGRGGDVYHVTNTRDQGEGSLREGIASASGPRTIVFEVSGTIKLKSNLIIATSYLTIAGQTAPGDGITLRGGTFGIEDAQHLIIRYLRVRYGDETRDDVPDAIRTNNVKHVIFDHISASWGVCSIHNLQGVESFTLQWSLYGQALHDIVHPAMLSSFRDVQGNISIHHNVFHSSRQRHPTLGGGIQGNREAVIDFRNNINYNWEGETNFGNLKINFINNYYKPGPSTDVDEKPLKVKAEFAEISRGYLSGNHFNGNPGFTQDNYTAIDYTGGGKYGSTTREQFEVDREFQVVTPATHHTTHLPTLLLPRIGASLKRDAVDQRIIAGIIDGTNVLINSQDEVGGWPTLQSLPAPADSDRDGMPDEWELDRGLEADTQDHNGADLSPEGYTNLEVYLHSLVVADQDH